MNVKMIFVLFSAGMALFLYNRAAPAGTVKSTHGVLTPAGAGSQADAAGAATAIPLPDISQPYGFNASDSTYHSDLGSGFSPDGTTSSFATSSTASFTRTPSPYAIGTAPQTARTETPTFGPAPRAVTPGAFNPSYTPQPIARGIQ